jgi:hypothetical protein
VHVILEALIWLAHEYMSHSIGLVTSFMEAVVLLMLLNIAYSATITSVGNEWNKVCSFTVCEKVNILRKSEQMGIVLQPENCIWDKKEEGSFSTKCQSPAGCSWAKCDISRGRRKAFFIFKWEMVVCLCSSEMCQLMVLEITKFKSWAPLQAEVSYRRLKLNILCIRLWKSIAWRHIKKNC